VRCDGPTTEAGKGEGVWTKLIGELLQWRPGGGGPTTMRWTWRVSVV